MKFRIAIISTLVTMLLGACASTPSNFYTLSVVGEIQTTSSPKPSVEPYVLGDISVPAAADQIPLVVQEADGRLLVLEYDRWGAPLSSQLQNALSRALTENLGFPPQQNLSINMQDKRNTRIRVAYQAFDMVPAQYAQALVVWQVLFSGSDKTLTCYSQLRQSVKPGVSELVIAQQKNVQLLAAQMSQAISKRGQPDGVTCQSK
jgi:uncharacterized lipoprotein YmbA